MCLWTTKPFTPSQLTTAAQAGTRWSRMCLTTQYCRCNLEHQTGIPNLWVRSVTPTNGSKDSITGCEAFTCAHSHRLYYTLLFLSASAFLLWCTRVDLCFSFQARLWTVSELCPWPLATPLTSCDSCVLCGLRWPIFVARLAASRSRILAGSSKKSSFLRLASYKINDTLIFKTLQHFCSQLNPVT